MRVYLSSSADEISEKEKPTSRHNELRFKKYASLKLFQHKKKDFIINLKCSTMHSFTSFLRKYFTIHIL